MRWCDRELSKPRIAQAAGQRELLDNFRGWGAALGGDLAEARTVVPRSPLAGNPITAALIELFGGEPARAAALCAASVAEAAKTGNAWTEMTWRYWLAN